MNIKLNSRQTFKLSPLVNLMQKLHVKTPRTIHLSMKREELQLPSS